MVAATRRPALVVTQFALLAVVWGASFLFIKVGLEGLSPAYVVLGRLLGGTAALVLISLVTRTRPPARGAVWMHLGIVGLLLTVVPFLLFAWAEQHISSGLASIYNATTPLMTMAIALLMHPDERPTRARLAGLATGFVGVLVVLGPWRGLGGGSGSAQAACLLATFCYGLAFVHLRRYVAPLGLPSVAVAAAQVWIGTVLMLALTPVLRAQPVHLTWRVVASIAILGILGTGVAYVWNTNVVAAWGATNASTVTYLTPVVGVLLGVLLLSERVSWNEPVGALAVVLGIAISQNRLRLPRRRHRVVEQAEKPV